MRHIRVLKETDQPRSRDRGLMLDKEKKRAAPAAKYANVFQVGHNAFEFLLEFGQQDSDIHTRIYLSPQHARVFSELLAEAVREHTLLTEKNEVKSKKNIQ